MKNRQEREEQRQQRTKEGVEATAQRQQYEAEAEQLETAVTQLLKENNVAESQQRIDALRKLVQDTANSISLTAHDMAKANAILARLQQLVDDARATQAGAKKFKFSSRLKTKVNGGSNNISESGATTTKTADGSSTDLAEAPASATSNGAAATTSAVATANATSAVHGSSSPGFGNVYGPSSDTSLFIADSKGVFINGCTNCHIYCLPIAGSVFLSRCVNCHVYVACHQLRLKDCRDTDIFVWCASTPIIESCSEMRFGPYRCWAGLLSSTAASTGATYATVAEWVRCVGEIADTAHTEDNYASVEDFQWVRKTASPNWRVMTEAEQTHDSTLFGPATPPN